jgi:hypothetical protein
MHDRTAVRTEGIAEQLRLHPKVKAEADEGYRGLADEFFDQVSAPPKKPKDDAPPGKRHAWREQRRRPGPGPTAAQSVGVGLAELGAPAAHCLVGDDDAALEHQLLGLAEAEREAEVQPHAVGDHLNTSPCWLRRTAASAASDSRDRRGRRYSLVSVLLTAACAVPAWARSYLAIGQWARTAR